MKEMRKGFDVAVECHKLNDDAEEFHSVDVQVLWMRFWETKSLTDIGMPRDHKPV